MKKWMLLSVLVVASSARAQQVGVGGVWGGSPPTSASIIGASLGITGLTDNTLIRADGTAALQGSATTLDDSGNVDFPGTISSGTSNAFTVSATGLITSAGAEDTARITLTDNTAGDSISQYIGTGSPEGVVTAQLASIYFRRDTGAIFVKASGDGTSTGWATMAAGSAVGDVVGPGSSTDNAIARFDGTTGKLLQNSQITIADTGAIADTDGTLNVTGALTASAAVSSVGLLNTGTNNTSGTTTANVWTSNVVSSGSATAWQILAPADYTVNEYIADFRVSGSSSTTFALRPGVAEVGATLKMGTAGTGFIDFSGDVININTNRSVAGVGGKIYTGANAAGEYAIAVGTSDTTTAQTNFAVANDVDGTPVYVFTVDGTGAIATASGGSAFVGTGGISTTGNLSTDGNFTAGDAAGDSVTSNAGAWTFANDTAVALSGGVNGLNFDSNTLSIDAANNRVGINTAAPTTGLHVASNGTTPVALIGDGPLSTYRRLTVAGDDLTHMQVANYNSTAGNFAALELHRGRGTSSAPTQVMDGDEIGEITFTAINDGGGISGIASIQAFATDNITPTVAGSRLLFNTITDGAADKKARLVLNATTAGAVFNVDQADYDFTVYTDTSTGIVVDASAETVDLAGGSGSTGVSISSTGALTAAAGLAGTTGDFSSKVYGNSSNTSAGYHHEFRSAANGAGETVAAFGTTDDTDTAAVLIDLVRDIDGSTASSSKFYVLANGEIDTEGGLITDSAGWLRLPGANYASGTPNAADCDNDSEKGRIYLDTANLGQVYFCKGTAEGWEGIALADAERGPAPVEPLVSRAENTATIVLDFNGSAVDLVLLFLIIASFAWGWKMRRGEPWR